jgi:hypothetical protein
VQNTRRLARNLIHGVEVTSDELGHGIRSLGLRLDQVQAADASARPNSNTVAPYSLEVSR